MTTDAASLISLYSQTLPIRAKSIISTVFGDIVLPFGDSIWLESLSQIVQPLGINDRLVRTTLYRLCEAEWTVGTRVGRKSWYQLTESAIEQTQQAEQSIYYPQSSDWDGNWLMVFLVITPVDRQARSELEQELKWMGFGLISKHVWAHPNGSIERLKSKIAKLDLENHAVCMQAQNVLDSDDSIDSLDDATLAQMCAPTEEVAKEYYDFVAAFSPLREHLPEILDNSSGAELLTLRILLIDQFRRIVLHDPLLPLALLPSDWAGSTARALCEEIYPDLARSSNRYYVGVSSDGSGDSDWQPPSKKKAGYSRRFRT